MKKFLKLEIVPLRKVLAVLYILLLRSCHGIVALSISETPALSVWCNFCDTFLHICSSFCFNRTFQVLFRDWQLFSPGLLSSSFAIDQEETNHVRVGALFSRSIPTPFVTSAQLASLSEDVISNILDLDVADIQSDKLFTEFVGGKLIHSIGSPLSHRYGGHQFGMWAGQLGDGRAHLIGEYVSCQDGSRWELQLKGSGKTPYSRDGDGRAVLRSSVREFLASEAMYHLG